MAEAADIWFLVAVSGEDCLKLFSWNSDSRLWTLHQEVSAESGPGPLAVSGDWRHLYAGLRGSRQIASYIIEKSNSVSKRRLQLLKTIEVDADPCFLRIDVSGKWLLAAYYGAGQVTVHGITPDGTLSARPEQQITTAPKAHCIGLTQLNSMVWVPHVGLENAVHEFQLDDSTGQLARIKITKATTDPLAGPAGPRHCAFHESTNSIYFSNEHASSVTHYLFDDSGLVKKVNTLSTLPTPYGTVNTCAQIHVVPAGSFLYVSNRGHDSLAIFSIDTETGALSSRGWQETEAIPRAFAISPNGHYLLCAGLGSGCLSIYRINPDTGHLRLLSRKYVGSKPMWVQPLAP